MAANIAFFHMHKLKKMWLEDSRSVEICGKPGNISINSIMCLQNRNGLQTNILLLQLSIISSPGLQLIHIKTCIDPLCIAAFY